MIETYTMPNGLRVVLERVPTVRSVSIGIWVFTGSRNESEEISGVSHFLEHMFFKGTNNRTAQDIAEAFDSIGGQVNAFTSKEYTCYYARVLDTYKEYALEVLTDMFFESTFPEDEIDRERNVVKEEIKMYEDTPDDHVHHLLSQASFGDHTLGRSILGSEAHLQTFTKETLLDYKNKFYTLNNIVVSVAVNVDNSIIQKIETAFDRFKEDHYEIERVKPVFKNDSIIKNRNTEQAHLCMGYNGLAIDDENIPTMMIINSVLGGGMSSRLFQEIREKRGLAYSVFSYHSSYLDSGMVAIYAGTNVDQLPLLEETIQQTMTDLNESGLTKKEFINSKEKLKGNMMLSLESTNSRMSRNGRNELLLNRHRTLDDMIHEIDAVNHESIQQMISRIFRQSPSSALIAPTVTN